MWKLTIEDDEGKQTSLPLLHDEYGLGRGEGNSIRLTDRNVSRKHASLKRNGQGWFVKDQQSYNGTYVNGVRVGGEQVVASGDIVQLGDYRIEIADEAVSQPVPSTDGGMPQGAPVVPVHQRPNRLVVVVGPMPGAEFPLEREHYTIGRAEDAGISINHSSVSRLHAELIALGNGRYEVIDKASANGIRINGVELRRGILEAGDALELGDVRLRFVGAGKIFRTSTMVDAGHGMRPMPSYESMAPSVQAPVAQTRGSGLGKLIGIGITVGILVIGGILVVVRTGPPAVKGPQNSPPAMATADMQLLNDARVLAEAQTYEAAHNKLLQISESSPVREAPLFAQIEERWADWMFARADQSPEAVDKRQLLQAIASTPTVDGDRRKKAADMIQALTAAEPQRPQPMQQNPGGTAPWQPPVQPGSSDPGSPATGSPGSPQPPSAPTTAKPETTTTPPVTGNAPPNEAAIRRSLEPKVWGGKASIDEIRMLKAICSHMGDRACRDRANAMLKQKQSGN